MKFDFNADTVFVCIDCGCLVARELKNNHFQVVHPEEYAYAKALGEL